MWDFKYGKPLKIEDIIGDIRKQEQEYGLEYDIISILGGDLLCHPTRDAMLLAVNLKLSFRNKNFWLFTGANSLPVWAYDVFDVIKYGEYKEELSTNGGFPASSNQKVIRRGINY